MPFIFIKLHISKPLLTSIFDYILHFYLRTLIIIDHKSYELSILPSFYVLENKNHCFDDKIYDKKEMSEKGWCLDGAYLLAKF